MIIRPAGLDTSSLPDGHYELWAGRELQAEMPAIAGLLAGMAAGRSISLTLTGEQAGDARWAGDPLLPSGASLGDGLLTILTSGTTGTPKRACNWIPGAMDRKRGGKRHERWLLSYSPWRWAGVSVTLHCLRFDGELIVPTALDPEALMTAAAAGKTTHVSLTPSIFRMLLVRYSDADLAALPLRQITFGGETTSQATLDTAAAIWPKAHITHTYASSEFGDICAVSDGRAGIPSSKFEAFHLSPNNELYIDGRPTGDLWELRGDRYHFLGRVEEMINVGGAKVSPFIVEEAALAVPGSDRSGPTPFPVRSSASWWAWIMLATSIRIGLARLSGRLCPASPGRRS